MGCSWLIYFIGCNFTKIIKKKKKEKKFIKFRRKKKHFYCRIESKSGKIDLSLAGEYRSTCFINFVN